MSDDTICIVCMLVADCPAPVPGSTVATCCKCDAKVWRAPSSFQLDVPADMLQIWCSPCAVAEIKKQDDPAVIMPITKQQLGELWDHFHKN